MNYELQATSKTPSLTIFLPDVSGSMGKSLGSKKRIEAARKEGSKIQSLATTNTGFVGTIHALENLWERLLK